MFSSLYSFKLYNVKCLEKKMKELYRLSENLRMLREQYGYTLKYVAEQLGIAYQSYQCYERGLTVPTLQNFIKLAKLYDVSMEELLE